MCFFFFKQKTAYDMRISDWSSDVCSSDLPDGDRFRPVVAGKAARVGIGALVAQNVDEDAIPAFLVEAVDGPCENIVVIHYAAPRVVPACAAPSGRRCLAGQ